MYYVPISYTREFVDLMMYLKTKYGQKLFDLEGIGKQLDMCKFSKDFFSATTTADASVDANANVTDTSNIAYGIELPKPYFKLNSYFMLWKHMRKLYGMEVANSTIEQQLTGSVYVNDFLGIAAGSPYCFNYSTYDIMLLGLPMVDKIKSVAPKYLYSFKSQLEQFVVIASNSTLGAAGLADLLIVMSYYVKNILSTKSDAGFSFKDEAACWNYVKETLVSFIYTINQPMRGNQSPFTNVSIYDSEFLNSLCPQYVFPDGSTPDIYLVQRIQELFLDVMNSEMKRTPVTFPITTACFSVNDDKKITDEAFIEFIAEKNTEFGFINMYIGKSSTLSSCCFTGDQKVLVRDSYAGVRLMPIEKYATTPFEEKPNATVYHDGSWVKGKTVKTKYTGKLYTIKTANKKEVTVTADHIFPTQNGDKNAADITLDEMLLFNSSPLTPAMRGTQELTYEDGLLIGAYLGDGSIYYRNNGASVEVTMSVTEVKLERLPFLKSWNIYPSKNNVVFAKSYSLETAAKIEEWVTVGRAPDKRLSMQVLDQPYEFREGILDGLYATDGGNSNRIYTTSEGLAEDLEVLLTSLGRQSIMDVSDRTDEPVVIRGEEFNRNYPLHCVRWYAPKNSRKQEGIYLKRNGNTYFKATEIAVREVVEEEVYCFEVLNTDEPYFTLPNGIITHNCRLRSDTDNEYFNSFGSGSSKIGSLGVTTINLPRLAFKTAGLSKDTAEREAYFWSELKELVGIAARVNHTKRDIVKSRIDSNNLPLYSLGFMDLSKQYSTLGVNGLNECLEILGLNILASDGQEFVVRILETINSENDKFQKAYKTPHNCEQIPGENVSIKLADKDRFMGYNDRYELYSNQFIPLTTKADLLDRIHLQGLFDSHFSGGAICHLNIEEKVEDTKKVVELIKMCAEKGVIYFALNYNLQRCSEGHMSVGKKETCGVCGGEVIDNYTRVVGFLTNVKNWHKVRREQDYPERQFYKEA